MGRPTTGPDRGSYSVLEGAAELLDLGLLAARAETAIRLAEQHEPLDGTDKAALARLARFLEDVAASLDYFGSSGTSGSPPTASRMASVDVALDAVPPADPERDLSDVVQRLRSSAEQLDRLISEPETTPSPELLRLVERLNSAVMRESASSGELMEAF